MNTAQKQRKAKLGKKNPNYRGGTSKASTGYITVPAPERGKGGKRKYQHQVVAKAKKGQVVHHKNKNRADNRPGNLVATKHHRGVKRTLVLDIAKGL